LFRGEGETVQAGLPSKPVEFDGIKIGVIELFPNAQEFNGVAVSQPVSDQVIGAFWILVPSNISNADVLQTIPGFGSDVLVEDLQFCFHRLLSILGFNYLNTSLAPG